MRIARNAIRDKARSTGALGGLPWHLRKVEAKTGMAVRTNDTEWERRSGSFVDAVVGFLRRTRLLYDDGGPVVMLQIENEYGNVEAGYGNAGKRYVVDLGRQIDALNARYNLNVPWIMCQQADAPPNAINTVNGTSSQTSNRTRRRSAGRVSLTLSPPRQDSTPGTSSRTAPAFPRCGRKSGAGGSPLGGKHAPLVRLATLRTRWQSS